MEKKGKKPGSLMRTLAIVCALALLIQAVPMQASMSVITNAAETSDEMDETKEESSDSSSEAKTEPKTDAGSGEDKKNNDNSSGEKDNAAEDHSEDVKNENKDPSTGDSEGNKKEQSSSGASSTDTSDSTATDESSAEMKKPSDSSAAKESSEGNKRTDTSEPSSVEDETGASKKEQKAGDIGNKSENSNKNNVDSTDSGKETVTDSKPVQETVTTPRKAAGGTADVQILNESNETVDSVAVKDGTVKLTANASGFGNSVVYHWFVDETSSLKNSVTLEDADQATVKISSVDGAKRGTITLYLDAKDGDNEVEKEITLKVYTVYGIDKIVLKDGKDNIISDGKADVSDTLTASLTYVSGAPDLDKDESAYSFQWQKKNRGGTFENISGDAAKKSSFKVLEEGEYRVRVTRGADDEKYCLKYEGDSSTVTASKIPVTVVWENQTKTYDGSKTFSYSGKGTVTRSDGKGDPWVISLSEPQTIELDSADANDYLDIDIDSGLDADIYNVSSSKAAKLTVNPFPVNATVTVWGKNFDNTAVVNAPEGEEELSVEWAGLDTKLEAQKKLLKLLLGGNALSDTDLVYSSAGRVDENTDVEVKLTGEAAEKSFTISGSDAETNYNNYTVKSVVFNKATIAAQAVTAAFDQEKNLYADVTSGQINNRNNTVWVNKNAKINLTAKEGYKIGADYSSDSSFQDTINDVAVQTSGGTVFYARNNKKEILKVTLSGIAIDKTAPTVNTVDIKKLNNSDYKNKYKVTDTEVGLKSVKVLISETDQSNATPDDTWTTVELPDGMDESDTNEFSFEIKVPAYGYVYIYTEDKLGNHAVTSSHIAIYEKTKPEIISLTCDDSAPTKGKSITFTVEDKPGEGESGSSGVKYVSIALADSKGNAVSNAFTVDETKLPSGVKFENDQFIRTNEDGPENLTDAGNYKTMTGAFSISENLSLNGDYTLTLTAGDYSGNVSLPREEKLHFDNTAPKYDVSLEDSAGSVADGSYYYNASAGSGLKVTFTDTNLTYVNGENKGGSYSAMLRDEDGKEITGSSPADLTGWDGTITFTTAQIKTLKDGLISLTVSAEDYAGNKAGEGSLTKIEPKSLKQSDSTVSFVLDTTAPVLSSSQTDIPESDQEPSLETPTFYYSGTFTTTALITETNMDENSVEAAYSADPEESTGSIEVQDDGRKIIFSGLDYGTFGYLKITGKDYAGNALTMDTYFSAAKSDGQDAWESAGAIEDGSGLVRTTYEREIENKIPLATVAYTKLNKNRIVDVNKKAYYKDSITVNIALTDIDGADFGRIEYAVQKDGATYQDWTKFTSDKVRINLNKAEDHTTDGDYRIQIRGKNRAGTGITVAETTPDGKAADTAVVTDGSACTMAYTLVLDTTSPVAAISIDRSEATNKELNSQYGNRYYFNKNHTATITIKEKNLNISDSSKGGVKVSLAQSMPATKDSEGKDQNDGYTDASKVTFSIDDFTTSIKGSESSDGAVFTYAVPAEGVRQYLVQGEDLAGNLVVYESADNIDTGFEGTGEGVFASYPVVTDTVKPLMWLTITATQDGTDVIAYKMDSNGAILASSPYQKAAKAVILAELAEQDAERTPFKISYHMVATDGTETDFANTAFAVGQTLSSEVSSQLVFRVEKFYVEDLAGNKTPDGDGYSTHDIYLDTELPGAVSDDILAPVIEIGPTIQTDAKYGISGTPLFNQDVPFSVKVKDPYGPEGNETKSRGSSGLKNVRYNLKFTNKNGDEETLIPDTELYTFDVTKKDGGFDILDDSAFAYTHDDTITIDSKANNYNSLILTITAVDNVGNEASEFYKFGIDVTDPEISLTYDNNTAKNGFYFNKPRTATIQVTERNFDTDLLAVAVTHATGGSKVRNAGNYEESEWVYKEGSAENGDDDTWTKKVDFKNDGDYTLEVKAGNYSFLKEGSEAYTTYAVIDHAGNPAKLSVTGENKVAPFKFVIDQTAPNVSIKMGGGYQKQADPDGHYYYKADNCRIDVSFDDNGHEFGMKAAEADQDDTCQYTVTISGEADGKTTFRKLDLDDMAFGSPAQKYRDVQTITYTAEELATVNRLLDDGTHVITVTAIDAAGNKASSRQLIKDSEGCEFADLSGTFILDTVRPLVTGIATSYNAFPYTDNKVYEDTNSVYYNKDINVQINIEDEYIRSTQFSGSVIQTPNDGTAEDEINAALSDDSNQIGKLVKAVYSMEGDNAYSGLTVSGCDKAGNLLLLADDYEHVTVSEVDFLQQTSEQSAKGQVSAVHGKVVDKTNPTAKIQYVSKDYANMYSKETKRGKNGYYESAYYNQPITVKFSFDDNYELDGNKLHAGRRGSESTGESVVALAKKHTAPDIVITKDGRGTYTAYGTDRALNPTLVSEMIPNTDKKHDNSFKDPVAAGSFKDDTFSSQKGFIPVYELVLDQTAPTFTLAVVSDKSTNKALNPQGNRYYFNKGYKATVTVKDKNYDASKITVKRGSVTSGTYNSQTEKISSYDMTITSKSDVFTDSQSSDGVYRYAVFGSDKAGNALVYSAGTNLDGTSSSVVDKSVEKENGSLEKTADTSVHIVIDKVAPQGDLEIKEDGTSIYKMDTKGSVSLAEPYRKKTNVSITFTVDTNVERSPVNIAYKVESTISSGNKNYSDSTYAYNNKKTTTQNGKQIFRVTNYTLTDLAGNVTTCKSANQIYLDKDIPVIDRIAPTISVVANAKSGTNGYKNGQPLFKSDVPLNIAVTDPDSGSSSGLADVTYQMYVGGSLVGGDTRTLHKANTKKYNKNYTDAKIDRTLNQTVTVSGSSHNNNDLRVVVTAYDNAGNMSTKEYIFGIDVTAPTVDVSYDNNSAQNGEYFKENRVATVVVTERNFEPSKFNIKTESGASISGWTHRSNGGNGDKDTWTARVTYARDGNYTLEVSGEDLLGNRATDINYNGTAPRKFTVDKTAPAVTVTYDNNDVANGKYYKAPRTATISVNDVNFAGQNDVKVNASGGGVAPSVNFNGSNAPLPFTEDGIYVFNGTVTDKAGNVTTIPEQTEFVIDTKAPVLRFEDGKPFDVIPAADDKTSDHPKDNKFFTKDGFAPKVTVVDTNCSTAETDAVLKITGTKDGNDFTGQIGPLASDATQFDISLPSTKFNVVSDRDDVYTVIAYAIDLAGNKSEEVTFTFSINRFGSNFVADEDSGTRHYIRERYYHNDTEHDLLIREYNPNAIVKDSQTVELITNGNTASKRTLSLGSEYVFQEDKKEGSKTGGRIYLYTIKKEVFTEEGDYSFTITSRDEAGHTNTTSSVHYDKDEDGKPIEASVFSFPIDFVVDKTPPTNQLVGVSSNIRQTFNQDMLTIDVYPEDAQTAVTEVEIRRWVTTSDFLGNPLVPNKGDEPYETRVYRYFAKDEMPKDMEEDLSAYTDPDSGQIKIDYSLEGSKDWQVVEVISTDRAGNKSTDIREGGSEEAGFTINESRRNYLVTSDLMTRLINNTAVRVGSVGAIALLILLLILLKRRKDKEKAAA